MKKHRGKEEKTLNFTATVFVQLNLSDLQFAPRDSVFTDILCNLLLVHVVRLSTVNMGSFSWSRSDLS